jgi:hypothetical protein
MNAPSLAKLRCLCATLPLREAIAEVCRPFAEVTDVDLVDDGERYYCYVQVAAPDQCFALLREVGAIWFRGLLCFVIPKT